MKAYLAFRKWVDRDLSRGPNVSLKADGGSKINADWYNRGGLSYLLVGLPILIAAAVERFPSGGLSKIGMLVAIPFSGLILAFIVWRQIRLLKARATKSGRYFERKARYALPQEYRNSEDGLLTRKRTLHDDR